MSDVALPLSSRAVLSTSAVRRSLPLSLVARLPSSAVGLLLVLRARELHDSYAVGGLASGGFALGMTIGSPLLARTIDRRGQSQVLAASAVAGSVALAALTTPVARAAPGLVAFAFLAGLTQPPISSCVRSIWARTLERAVLHRILALEASLQELTFSVGPVLFVLLATHWSARVALGCAAVLLLFAVVAFARLKESRQIGAGPHATRLLSVGPLSSRGIRLLFVVTFALGASFGAIQIGVVARTDRAGAAAAAGLMFAVWNVGSLLGGLASAHAPVPRNLAMRVSLLLWALAVMTALLSLTPGIVGLAAGLLAAGTCIAPTVSLINQLTGEVAPAAMMTEAYALESTALLAGIAAGAASAGSVVTPAGPSAAFILGALALAAAGVLVRARGVELATREAA